MHLKHRQQLGHLQQVSDPARQICQLDRSAGVMRRGVQRHESSQAARIDVADLTEVQHNAFAAIGNRLLYLVPYQRRLFAEHNTPAALNRQNSVNCSPGKFQLHLRPLLRGGASRIRHNWYRTSLSRATRLRKGRDYGLATARPLGHKA